MQRRAREPLSANRRERCARAATSSSAPTHMWRCGRHRTPVTPSLGNRAPTLPVRVREHALALPPTCPPHHASAIVHLGANRARLRGARSRPGRAARTAHAPTGAKLRPRVWHWLSCPPPRASRATTHRRPTSFCELLEPHLQVSTSNFAEGLDCLFGGGVTDKINIPPGGLPIQKKKENPLRARNAQKGNVRWEREAEPSVVGRERARRGC